MHEPQLPKGYNTVNTFIITSDALKLVEFVVNVFEAEEDPSGRTFDKDGLLLHSEIIIGNSRIFIVDRKPNWPFSPGFNQVYVSDIESTLRKAENLGARIITKPTDLVYGELFSRFQDPWNNIWWVCQHDPNWQVETTTDTDSSEQSDETWVETEEMIYIHDSLMSAMENLGKGK